MAEKRVIELEVKSDSLGSLKSQLRQAQNEVNELSAKFGATSKEAINAAKKAAELKDAIGDAKALTDAFNPDAKFNALSTSIGGVLNGFQAFEGALGLVGVESEDLQKTLLKVQSAMALSQGVQGLMEAKDSFKQLGAVAMDALKGIRTGIAATGIGLLVVALGAIVAYWDDIKSAISGVSAEQEALNAKSQKDVDIQKEKLESLDSQDNILKLQGLTEKQILQLKIKQTDEAIKAYEISIKNQQQTLKAQIEAEKRNNEYLKGATRIGLEVSVIAFRALAAPLDLLITAYNKIAPALNLDKIETLNKKITDMTSFASEKIASFVFDPKAVEAEGLKAINEQKKALAELKNEQAGFKLEIQAIDKEAADKRAAAAKEAREKRKAEFDKDKEESQKQADDILSILKNRTKKEDEIISQSSITKEELYKREAERINKLREDEFKDAQGYLEAELIANEFNLDARLQLLDLQREKELQNKELTEGEITAIEAKYAKQREELSKQEADRKAENQLKALNSAKQSLQGIADLASLFAGKSKKEQEKAFKVQKAVNIAQATIDTFTSAQAAYKSVVGIPVVGPGLAIAAAAAAVAAGLANIKKISAAKFEGGGTPDSSTPPAPNVSGGTVAPAFNIVGNAQAQNPLAGLGQQPIKAYVVSGEVTTAQSLDRQKVYSATFG